MKSLISLSVFLFIFTGSVNAQLGFGPETGLNVSGYNVKSGGHDVNTSLKYGWRIGAIIDWGIAEHIYLQPGAIYVTNGYKKAVGTGTETILVNTIEIPVNVEYKFDGPGEGSFFVGLGPYIGFNKGGAIKLDAGTIQSRWDMRLGSDSSSDFKVVDYGAGINVGYQIADGFFVRLRSEMGLPNLKPKGNADNSVTSYNFGLTIGYLFGRD